MAGPQPVDARAAVVRSPGGDFVIEPVRLRPPLEDEVLVHIAGCGLCHADLIARNQEFPVPLPVVLGHEGAGIVSAFGSSVTDLSVGDHVVLSFGSCGACRWCKANQPAYCVEFIERNFGCAEYSPEPPLRDAHDHPIHGRFFSQSSLGTYALARRNNVIRVSKDLALELLGPLGCGIQSGAGAIMNALDVKAGTSVAIFGMGAVGLSALLAARCVGAGTIIAIDVVASRLELARELGATHIVDGNDPDIVTTVRKAAAGGADYAVEASGHPTALKNAIEALGVRGAVAVLGSPPPGTRVDFDVHDVLQSGKIIRGVVEGDSQPETFIPRLIALQQEGRFPFEKLVRFYDFEDINRAVADSERGATPKAIVRMAPSRTA